MNQIVASTVSERGPTIGAGIMIVGGGLKLALSIVTHVRETGSTKKASGQRFVLSVLNYVGVILAAVMVLVGSPWGLAAAATLIWISLVADVVLLVRRRRERRIERGAPPGSATR